MEHREIDQGVGGQEKVGDNRSNCVQFTWKQEKKERLRECSDSTDPTQELLKHYALIKQGSHRNPNKAALTGEKTLSMKKPSYTLYIENYLTSHGNIKEPTSKLGKEPFRSWLLLCRYGSGCMQSFWVCSGLGGSSWGVSWNKHLLNWFSLHYSGVSGK